MSSNLIIDDNSQIDVNLTQIPISPGCYLFLDSKGKVIYVGKAQNLRTRIRSYFQKTDSRYHIKFLLSKTHKIDYLVTSNEKEALLLEDTLIKQHKPKYNIRLKDDKNFLSLRIDPTENFPRLTFVRRPKKDGALYFGPYQSASSIREVYKQLHFIVPLRQCSDSVFNNRSRPCLYYQIGTCLAPCVNLINKEEYDKLVQQAILILQGKSERLEEELKKEIEEEKNRLNFERAIILRDRLFALQRVMQPQRTILHKHEQSVDVWGLYTAEKHVNISVLFYREGKLQNSRFFRLQLPVELPPNEYIGSLLIQMYSQNLPVPNEILIPVEIEEVETVKAILNEQHKKTIEIHTPKRGEKKELIELANKNAQIKYLEETKQQTQRGIALQEIQKILRMDKLPKRIECFDASTLQGSYTVVGMVVYEEGKPKKSDYRKFSIHIENTVDDYYALREAIRRRFQDLTDLPYPDLLLIDGGKGHLNVAVTVLKDLQINGIYTASIAKSRWYVREKKQGSTDRLFISNRSNPILPPTKDNQGYLLLQQIRDEAHRFVIHFHRQRRNKYTLQTSLKIPGIGESKLKLLLAHFKTIDNLKSASIEELQLVKGIGKILSKKIYEYFRSN